MISSDDVDSIRLPLYEASKHAEKNKRNVLTFETPNGDVAMSVQKLGNVTQITKLK